MIGFTLPFFILHLLRRSSFAVIALWITLNPTTIRAKQNENATANGDSTSTQSENQLGIDELSKRVVQLLQAKCSSCHGADQVEGGFRVDSKDHLFTGGDRGLTVISGDPEASLLYRCIAGREKDLQMPPKSPLSANEVDLVKQWLTAGAKWPDEMATDAGGLEMSSPKIANLGDAWSDSRNPIRQMFGGERLNLWSLVPVKPPVLPQVGQPSWCKNEIDYFALSRFEAAGMTPPVPADRHALLRRIHFDLTGLPPSPELSQKFKASSDDRDVERLVDQLLDSPQFGIHWARMWLDVARYSDSNGFDWDEFRPQAWRYRDYVVRSLNQDKPYDQFLREQLAGDEMISGSPENVKQQDALLATGFLRMGPHDNAAKLFNEQDRSRDELMTDLVETTGGAILGLTLSCCRCHDHKYDPLSQADHFRLRACFAGVQFADDTPIDLAKDRDEIDQFNQQIDVKITRLEEQRNELLDAIQTRLNSPVSSDSNKVAESSSDVNQSSSEINRSQQTESASLDEPRPNSPAPTPALGKTKKKTKKLKPDELKKSATEQEKARLDDLDEQIKQASSEKRPLTFAMLMLDDEQPAETFVLFQGDYKAPRGKVEPGILSVLNPNALQPSRTVREKTSGRRTALVDWIVSPDNPLTARVMVNRVWQNLFGQGLVRTPGDFGLAGSAPDDQQLLDWLAYHFVAEGWSVKKLIRTIVLSSTYQQTASFRHPQNSVAHVVRQPRRLTAEQLRDSMLFVSGLLTDKNAGPPQWPDLPKDVLEANPAFLDDNETKTKGWYPSPRAEQHCRSIFLVQKRNTRVPLLETLDQPENSVPCQRRPSSIVAPQALSLLNSPEAIEAAKSFARRLEDSTKSTREQIVEAFQLALGRVPTPTEMEQSQQLIEKSNLVELCRVLLNINEFAYID